MTAIYSILLSIPCPLNDAWLLYFLVHRFAISMALQFWIHVEMLPFFPRTSNPNKYVQRFGNISIWMVWGIEAAILVIHQCFIYLIAHSISKCRQHVESEWFIHWMIDFTWSVHTSVWLISLLVSVKHTLFCMTSTYSTRKQRLMTRIFIHLDSHHTCIITCIKL